MARTLAGWAVLAILGGGCYLISVLYRAGTISVGRAFVLMFPLAAVATLPLIPLLRR